MREILDDYEQSLANMISSNMLQSLWDVIKTMIHDLRLKIASLEAEKEANQTVCEDLVAEMKANLD